MAIMGRTKKANAQMWEAKNRERKKKAELEAKQKSKEVPEREHKKRLKSLKDAGILK